MHVWLRDLNTDFTLKVSKRYIAVKLSENADKDKYR